VSKFNGTGAVLFQSDPGLVVRNRQCDINTLMPQAMASQVVGQFDCNSPGVVGGTDKLPVFGVERPRL